MNIIEFFSYQDSKQILPMDKCRMINVFLDSIKEHIGGKLCYQNRGFREIFIDSNSFEYMNYKAVLDDSYSDKYANWCYALSVNYLLKENPTLTSMVQTDKMRLWLDDLNDCFDKNATELFVEYIREKWGRFPVEEYIKIFRNSSWKQMKAAQQATGTWVDSEWEIYNHWSKMTACGATLEQIKEMYCFMTEEEPTLDISNGMKPDCWKSYVAWKGRRLETVYSLKNASGSYEYMQGMNCGLDVFNIRCTSEYATEYIRTTPLHRVSSGCCFSGDTCILMENGIYKPIDTVVKGDVLISLDGKRRVLLISKPYRRGRKLYSINNWNPKFTCEHPVVVDYSINEKQVNELGFIEPQIAIEAIPQFKELHTSKIEKGTKIYAYSNGTFISQQVESIQMYENVKDDFVYDIVLEPEEGRYDSFIVGNEDGAFVVLTELPALWKYPEATKVLINVLQIYGKEICEKNAPISYIFGRNNGIFENIRKAIGDKIYKKINISNFHSDYNIKFSSFMQEKGKFSQDMGVLCDLLIAELGETIHLIFNSKSYSEDESEQMIKQLSTFIGEGLIQMGTK